MAAVICSAIPVIIIGLYVYLKDKNREPVFLLIKLFIGGIASILITLALNEVWSFIFPIYAETEFEDLPLFAQAADDFIGAGLFEEFSKWLIVFIFAYRHREFDEVYDIIIYCAFVALGFAFYENVLYLLDFDIYTAIYRGIFSLPGHALDGIIMGCFYGIAKQRAVEGNRKAEKRYLALSIFVPAFQHGLFDFFITLETDWGTVMTIGLYIVAIIKINRISKANKKLVNQPASQPAAVPVNFQPVSRPDAVPLNAQPVQPAAGFNFCPVCGAQARGNFCRYCGTKLR